jgi:hypothetical protein
MAIFCGDCNQRNLALPECCKAIKRNRLLPDGSSVKPSTSLFKVYTPGFIFMQPGGNMIVLFVYSPPWLAARTFPLVAQTIAAYASKSTTRCQYGKGL